MLTVLAILLGAGYTLKDRYAYRFAEVSRQVVGDERTARIESWYFSIQDKGDQLKYKIFGGAQNPFSQDQVLSLSAGRPDEAGNVPMPAAGAKNATLTGRAPLPLPETRALHSNPGPGEGVWTTDGLPRSSPGDVLMAKTYIDPDQVRPYARVGVLLLDKARIRLHIIGGTVDPGGDLGVKGPGVIPEPDRKQLLVAWNGGFRGPHGGFGMYADGKQYRPLRDGLASVAVTKSGTMKIGQWGRDLTWSNDFVAVRQNAALLVDNCEVSKRTSEGNNTWGYVEVNSAEFITWRSAIGLTQNGDLLVAAGNSLSAESLARALWAAGACWAMQLDINSPYVLISLFFPQPDGSITAAKFMPSMADNPRRFLTTQPHDFMYATLDESNQGP